MFRKLKGLLTTTGFWPGLLALLWVSPVAIGQTGEPTKIELHFDGDSITWPQIWDSGFRPVYDVGGKEHCQQRNILLSIRFRDEDEVFNLGGGDVQFSILNGDVVFQIAFFGRTALTLEEGSETMASFSRVFRKKLEKAGSPLEPMDSYGTVDTSKNTENSIARFGEYRILHGFRSSYRPETPLLNSLTVSLPSKRIRQVGFRTTPIEPPEGYKHISMKPRKLDLGAAKKEQGDLLNEPRKFPPAETRTDAEDAAPGRKTGLWVWVLLALIVATSFWVWKRGLPR